MTTTMSPSEALTKAQSIVGDRATVSLHKGDTPPDVALRITGTTTDEARGLAIELMHEFHPEDFVFGVIRTYCRNISVTAGFVVVWL